MRFCTLFSVLLLSVLPVIMEWAPGRLRQRASLKQGEAVLGWAMEWW